MTLQNLGSGKTKHYFWIRDRDGTRTLKDFNASIHLQGNKIGDARLERSQAYKTRSVQNFMPQKSFHLSIQAYTHFSDPARQ